MRNTDGHHSLAEPRAAPARAALNRPFVPWAGFWMGGFEGADHVNAAGRRLDMAWASGHVGRLEEDHRRAAQAGLAAVRESVGWRLAESVGGEIDLARVRRIADSARAHGLQVLWTLMHYGLPDGLSLHDDALIPRFARFAAAVARALREHGGAAPRVYTPVHEIGFTAFAAAQSGYFAPPNGLPSGHEGSSLVCGYAVKRRLARAVLAAIDAIRAVDPQARFLHVEPLLHVVAPPEAPQYAAEAEVVRGWQWQAWDLIAGRLEPQLGGRPDALDLVGVVHSPSSQWELLSEHRLGWQRRDPRWRPFAELLDAAWQRYGRPLMVAGTGHVGGGRAAWLHDLADQVRRARGRGVPVHGLTLYPLVDRPEWHAPAQWRRSGLWHVAAQGGVRVVEQAYRGALARWQDELPQRRTPPSDAPLIVLAARRWDSQPLAEQPVLEALARRRRVLVIEPPWFKVALARLDARAVDPALEVLVPHLPRSAARRGRTLAPLLELLQPWLAARGLAGAQVWPLARSQRTLARALAGTRACLLLPPPASVDLGAHRLAATRVVAGWCEDELRRLDGANGGPRIGCVDSGSGELVDAALLVELADLLPAVQLVLVGEALAQLPPLQVRRPNVLLLPTPPAPLLPALLASWAAVLRPLREAGSGVGLVQALASGRPVIASGAPEIADAPRLGVVCAEGVVALAAAVRAAIFESPAAARRRRRCSAAFLRERDAHAIAARLHRALQACG